MPLTSLQTGWLVGLLLLGIGLLGLLISRNLLRLIIALQILVKSALLALVLSGNTGTEMALVESLCVTVIVADTIVAVVALAFAIQIRRHVGSLDIRDLASLRG